MNSRPHNSSSTSSGLRIRCKSRRSDVRSWHSTHESTGSRHNESAARCLRTRNPSSSCRRRSLSGHLKPQRSKYIRFKGTKSRIQLRDDEVNRYNVDMDLRKKDYDLASKDLIHSTLKPTDRGCLSDTHTTRGHPSRVPCRWQYFTVLRQVVSIPCCHEAKILGKKQTRWTWLVPMIRMTLPSSFGRALRPRCTSAR